MFRFRAPTICLTVYARNMCRLMDASNNPGQGHDLIARLAQLLNVHCIPVKKYKTIISPEFDYSGDLKTDHLKSGIFEGQL